MTEIDLFQGARIKCLSNRDKLIAIVYLIPSPLLNPFQGSLELDSVGLLFQFCIGRGLLILSPDPDLQGCHSALDMTKVTITLTSTTPPNV